MNDDLKFLRDDLQETISLLNGEISTDHDRQQRALIFANQAMSYLNRLETKLEIINKLIGDN